MSFVVESSCCKRSTVVSNYHDSLNFFLAASQSFSLLLVAVERIYCRLHTDDMFRQSRKNYFGFFLFPLLNVIYDVFKHVLVGSSQFLMLQYKSRDNNETTVSSLQSGRCRCKVLQSDKKLFLQLHFTESYLKVNFARFALAWLPFC